MPGALVLLLLIALSFPLSADETLRRGLGPEPDSLDIHQAQGLAAINLLRDLREGLVTYNSARRTGSWCCRRMGCGWMKAGSTGLNCGKMPRWSDGSPVVAGDFLRGLRAAVDPATAAATAGLLAPIVNAEGSPVWIRPCTGRWAFGLNQTRCWSSS